MASSFPGLDIPDKDVCHYHIYLKEPIAARAAEVRALATTIHAPWTKDYIWQEESFALNINDEHTLSGETRFGDCVEDEWLIVWILTELSRQCADLFIQVSDTDGEFLLIEAGMHLPRWLEPEVATNRNWIKGGQFIVIPPTGTEILNKQCPSLSLAAALAHLRADKEVLHSLFMEKDAFARIRNYPEQARKEIHRVACALPRVLATMLHNKPALVAPLAIACYHRDEGQATRFKESQAVLSDEEVQDVVETTVRFTKTLYAQLIGSRFEVPNWWHNASDIKSDVGCRLLAGLAAVHDDRVGKALRHAQSQVVTNEQIESWREEPDSDDYLHVNFDELEETLAGNGDQHDDAGASDETIKKMVEQMQKFMNTDSTFEGAEFSGDEDEDEFDDDDDDKGEDEFEDYDEDDIEDGFGEEDLDFMDFLRSSVTGSSAVDALRKTEQSTRSPSKDIQENRIDDEAESDDESVGDLKEYMAAMDAELSKHGLSSRAHTNVKESNAEQDGKDEDVDEDEDLQIDFAMAKNMLESIQSSGGMRGPAAGLLGRMGISLPRNDEEPLD